MNWRSRLRDEHARSRTLWEASKAHEPPAGWLEVRRPTVCPMLALRTSRNLGPVRHVLSQRIVAGVMIVHQPKLGPPSEQT